MSAVLTQNNLDFASYLAGERDSDSRHEYIDGQTFAMAGASEVHNTIANALSAHIELNLRDGCRAWQSDMKVIGETANNTPFAYYPDIMAACGENEDNPYYRTNPILIVEVLSPNTQRIDISEKFHNYIRIDSLQEYLIVAQDAAQVRLFRRRNDWQVERYSADDTLTLESVELTLKVRQIYRRVLKEVGLA